MEELLFKATVTGKRQITIPRRICQLLNIQTGKQVIFRQQDNKILFEVDEEYEPCFACKGVKVINNRSCFICNGVGTLNKEMYSDIYKLIGFISLNSNKFNIDLKFISQDKTTPKINLISEVYKKETLEEIENKIQQMIKEQFK